MDELKRIFKYSWKKSKNHQAIWFYNKKINTQTSKNKDEKNKDKGFDMLEKIRYGRMNWNEMNETTQEKPTTWVNEFFKNFLKKNFLKKKIFKNKIFNNTKKI